MRTILHILLFLCIAYCQVLVTQPMHVDDVWISPLGITYYEIAVMALILLVMVSIIVRVKGKVALISIGIIQILSLSYFINSLVNRIMTTEVVNTMMPHYLKPAPRYVFGILICFYLIFFYQYIGSVRRARLKRIRD